MSKLNYSTWLTKQQAAEAIGVSTKTIEKLAQDKKLQQAFWKRPGTGASVAVYHPEDVEREQRERNPDAEPFVVPLVAENRAASTELAVVPAADQFVQAIVAAVATSQNSQKSSKLSDVRTAERLFLTLSEAATYSGLPRSYIRSLMTEGKLEGLKTGAGWRIRRTDLEKL